MNARRDFNKPLAGQKRIAAAPLVHMDLMLEGASGWLWDRDFVRQAEAMCGHKTRLGAREFLLISARPAFVRRLSPDQTRNLSRLRALALAASSSLLRGGAVVARDASRREETAATSSTAVRKAASLALEGLLKPLIFLTNWREAACTSSSVTGGSKLKSILMFRHIEIAPLFELRVR